MYYSDITYVLSLKLGKNIHWWFLSKRDASREGIFIPFITWISTQLRQLLFKGQLVFRKIIAAVSQMPWFGNYEWMNADSSEEIIILVEQRGKQMNEQTKTENDVFA